MLSILIWLLNNIVKEHIWLCVRSQYYKHDFAILSSTYDLWANYAVVGFVKYFENIIRRILQHKYVTKYQWGIVQKTKFKSTILWIPRIHCI